MSYEGRDLCSDCGWADHRRTKRERSKATVYGYKLLLLCRQRNSYVWDLDSCGSFVHEDTEEGIKIRERFWFQ